MHKLSASFVLGYHGCDQAVGERLLRNEDFRFSQNDYDWLGEGIYFWEANPLRGLQFAQEVAAREPKRIKRPFVVGAILDLGYCLDLTTSAGLQMVKDAFQSLSDFHRTANRPMPVNFPERLKHPLDCQVINHLHKIHASDGRPPIDSIKAIFQEPPKLYPGSIFMEKNHIQIAVRNIDCIKGVFRVPKKHLDPSV